jgi:hypothetical protein
MGDVVQNTDKGLMVAFAVVYTPFALDMWCFIFYNALR